MFLLILILLWQDVWDNLEVIPTASCKTQNAIDNSNVSGLSAARMLMKKSYRLFIITALVSAALPLFAAPKDEQSMLADLDSPRDKVVVDGLNRFEKEYPTSAPALAKTRILLTDSRPLVRRKAARVLGALHTDVTDAEMQSIAKLLDAPEKVEVMEGLKALRGLKAQSVVPKIVPLLKNPDNNVKRDACRTLAVLGDKSLIPSIEPLTQDADKLVAKDANDAIFALKNK